MKKIITGLCLMLASLSLSAKQNILIYVGPGAGPKSIVNTVATVQAVVSDDYIIETVGPEYLIDPTWINNTALLIMPGGADRPYVEKLSGAGNANIKKYVENGGKYLGICAGAYYSSDRIEFAKGDKILEVTGERELKFFPGLVEGPTYAGFDHRNTENVEGMRAATIHWIQPKPFAKDEEFTVFYNGGGHFVDAEKFKNVKILARYGTEYSQPNMPAAIVECEVGKGTAILSGPHFEWFAQTLEGDNKELMQIRAKLAAKNEARLNLARHLFSRLEISTKS